MRTERDSIQLFLPEHGKDLLVQAGSKVEHVRGPAIQLWISENVQVLKGIRSVLKAFLMLQASRLAAIDRRGLPDAGARRSGEYYAGQPFVINVFL
jgi:hypothetical protein